MEHSKTGSQQDVDLSVIEFNLSLTLEQRLENHEAALALMLDLQDVGKTKKPLTKSKQFKTS